MGALIDHGRKAFDCIDALEQATDPDAVRRRFAAELADYGLHAWLISGLPAPGGGIERLMLLNGWPAGWTRLYLEESYVADDPVVAHCARTAAPFSWDEAPVDPRPARGAEVMARARDFGMISGFAVPIHDGLELSVVTMAGEAPDLGGHARRALHLVSLYAHARARALVEPPAAESLLSPREREVVTWIALGKKDSEIAELLGISPETVDYHLRSAAQKFRVRGRTRIAVEAICRREVKI